VKHTGFIGVRCQFSLFKGGPQRNEEMFAWPLNILPAHRNILKKVKLKKPFQIVLECALFTEILKKPPIYKISPIYFHSNQGKMANKVAHQRTI
jgi:hypothetical protein